MEIIRKIYTCEIPMFDEEGDDWTEEYTDFYNSLDDLIKNPGYFKIECIPKLMELFNDTFNYDTLMSALADLVINIACFLETRVYINYWILLYALRLREECMEKCIS